MRRRWSMSALCLLLVSSFVRSESQRVVLTGAAISNGSRAEIVARFVGALGSGASQAQETRSVLTSGQGSIDLAPGLWDIAVSSPGHWAPVERVEVNAGDRELRLRLWLGATLSGALSFPQGDKSPAEVTLVFSSAPGVDESRAVDKVSTVCPVNNGIWRCDVPAIPLDVQVRAKDCIPHYVWDLNVTPGREFSLGRVTLERGASLVGWVKRSDGGPVDGVQVSIAPMGGTDKGQTAPRFLPIAPVRATRRGFFQLKKLSGGDCWVTATTTELPPGILPVNIAADTETALHEPLILAGLSRLSVQVDPPLDPWGAAWSLKLVQVSEQPGAGHFSEEAAHGTADRSGKWSADRLSQGRYLLIVLKEQEGSWHTELIEVAGGVEQSVAVSIGLVTLRGRLRLGSSPLQATLWFGGKNGADRVDMHSDKDGVFEGLLSRTGSWIVDILATEPELQRRLEVEVPESSTPDIDITLPDTLLAGTTVDATGKPWPGARVTIHPLAEQMASSFDSADEEGHFEFRGMTPGPVQLWADGDADHTSGPVMFNVEQAGHAAPQTVTIREKLRLSGHVFSAGEPVGGATVTAVPGPEVVTSVRPVRTGQDGSFSVSVPYNTRTVDLRILAKGYVYKRLAISLPSPGPIRIALPVQGGRLVLEYPDPPNARNWSSPVLVAYHDGQWDYLGSLERWSSLNGESTDNPHLTVIPQVEAGDWAFCFVTPGKKRPGSPAEFPRGSCVSGTLLPGGELRLVVPSPPDQTTTRTSENR